MIDVFVSYKSERRPAAWHLAKVLELYGFSAWYDYDLIPGEDFENAILKKLDSASVCIVLWCKKSGRSEWVAREVKSAWNRSVLLPCKLEECAVPALYERLETIDLAAWNGSPRSHSLDRLLLEVSRRVGRVPTPNFTGLIELDEQWRMLGSPTLANFALGVSPTRMIEPTSLVTTTSALDVYSESYFVGTDWRLYYSEGGHRDVWLLSDGNARWSPDGFVEKLFRYSGSWSFSQGILRITLSEKERYPDAFARYEMTPSGEKLLGRLYYDSLGTNQGMHGVKMKF